MLQHIATIESKYKLFIEKAADSKLVWGLKNKDGWANSHANGAEDIDVVPFWSDKAYAKACAKNEWKSYLPVHITLADFLENWCVGMAANGTLVGTNWDANMFGKETEAWNVALDILNALASTQTVIAFVNYGSVDEFITEIKESIDQQ